MRITLVLLLALCLASCSRPSPDSAFVTVDHTTLRIGDQPYHFLGTNFWYGLNLGSTGPGGDRARLTRELDRLAALGVTNLRVMAASEGPDDQPYRMVPALQTAPGQYNPQVLEGLDFLLQEMGTRHMRAVMCLSNFWPWSGGFGQYIVWSGTADSIPYPPPHPGGDWDKYQKFTAQFYTNAKAVSLLNDHITYIVNRTNALTGLAYKDDPTIMSWQLCNEPRGIDNIAPYKAWIDQTSALIRSLDPHHLITIGSEGHTSAPEYSGTLPDDVHAFKNIDYVTMHLWVQNWNVYDPLKADSTYAPAVTYALNYIRTHEALARRLGKPLVMEEFGISRDTNSHAAGTPTTIRDKYYEAIFAEILSQSTAPGSTLSGVNFWAWGGEGRPRTPQCIWKPGDDFIGDPPHEFQGWYSVFDTDTTTQRIIKTYATKMAGINAPPEH